MGVVTGIRRALRFRVVQRAECFSPLFSVFSVLAQFGCVSLSGAGRLISLCRVVRCTRCHDVLHVIPLRGVEAPSRPDAQVSRRIICVALSPVL